MASAVVGSLRVNLGIETAQFSRGLKQSQGSLDRFAKAAKIGFAAVAAAAAGAAAGMAAAFVAFSKDADQLAKLSQALGVSVEDLSRMRHAADKAGMSFDQLTTGLRVLTKNLSDVAAGSKGPAAQAFRALGVDVVDANGNMRQAVDVLDDIADGFAGMADGSQKTALAIGAFNSRIGGTMIPMLNQGGAAFRNARKEADDFGITISTKTAQAAERFNDNLGDVRKIMGSVTTIMSAAALPAFEQLSQKLVDAAKNTTIFQDVGAAAGVALTGIATALEGIAGWIGQFSTFVGLVERLVAAGDALSNGALFKLFDRLGSGPPIGLPTLSALASKWLGSKFPDAPPGLGPAEVTVRPQPQGSNETPHGGITIHRGIERQIIELVGKSAPPLSASTEGSAFAERLKITNEILTGIGSGIDKIGSGVDSVGSGIANLGPEFGRATSGIPGPIVNAVGSGVSSTVSALGSGFASTVSAIQASAQTIGATLAAEMQARQSADINAKPGTGFRSSLGIASGTSSAGSGARLAYSPSSPYGHRNPFGQAMAKSAFSAGKTANVFADGGLVRGPGGPRSDSVPVMASAGEYVVNAAAVRKIGVAGLDAINEMRVPTSPMDPGAANQAAMLRFADATSPTGSSSFAGSRGEGGVHVGDVRIDRGGMNPHEVMHLLERRLEQFVDDLDTVRAHA